MRTLPTIVAIAAPRGAPAANVANATERECPSNDEAKIPSCRAETFYENFALQDNASLTDAGMTIAPPTPCKPRRIKSSTPATKSDISKRNSDQEQLEDHFAQSHTQGQRM